MHSIKYLLLICFLFSSDKLISQEQKEFLFQFGIIADVQYADRENHNTRHYRSSLRKLIQAVEVFNEEKVSFVISLGDFINDNYRSFDTINSIAKKLQMPLHHVLGNHDFSVNDDKKDNVLSTLGLQHAYYSFEKKNWRFIVLNGMEISLIANIEGSPNYKKAVKIYNELKAAGAKNAKPWNGFISSQQLRWLKKELSKAENKNEQVIVLCHFPLYPEGSAKILWGSHELRGILETSSHIKAYLNGHVHVSQYFLKENINYVSFKGMVEGKDNAFAIISVFKDHLEIKGYGKEMDRTLK